MVLTWYIILSQASHQRRPVNSYFKIFEFISDEELKKELILDYKEVLTCMKRKAPKGAVVIAGGIVEAILKNRALHLTQDDKQKVEEKYLELTKSQKAIEKMDLYYLIKTLESLKFITSPQASRSDVLRDYRNLIHPFKNRKRPTKSDSESVKKLLDDLINEFGKDVEPELKNANKAKLFLTHSKWKAKRERTEYKEILKLLHEKSVLSFDDLLDLPSFRSKTNPSKSLIAHLNYLRDNALCSYDPASWQGAPIRRFEKWSLNHDIRDEVGEYLKTADSA